MRKGTSRKMHFFICGLAYESVSFILTRKNETTTERIQSCLYTPLKLIFPKRRETKKQAEKTTTSWSKGEPKKCTARIGKTQTDHVKSGWTDLRTEVSLRLLVTGDIPVFGELLYMSLTSIKPGEYFLVFSLMLQRGKKVKSPSEMLRSFLCS